MKNFAVMAATAIAVIGTMAGGMMTTEVEAKVSGVDGYGTSITSYETGRGSRHSHGNHISGHGYYDDYYDDDYYDDDYYDDDYEENDCRKYGGNYYYDDGENYYEYYGGNLVCP